MNRQEIVSPCVRLCTLNEAQICIGCGRSLNEICEWSQAPVARQREIKTSAAERLATMPKRTWEDA